MNVVLPPETAPLPPQNLEAEESVIGAMMISSGAIVAVSEILAPGDFYRHSHGLAYRTAVELHEEGEPVDAITLVDALEKRGRLEDAGGRQRIHELAALVPASANAAHYARMVRDAARRRDEIDLADAVFRAASNGGVAAHPELLAWFTDAFAREADDANGPVAIPASAIKRERIEWIKEGYVPKGMLTILAGQEGLGKSMFTNGLAAQLSKQGKVTLFLTAEDSRGVTEKPRLEAANADLEFVRFASMRRNGIDGGFSFPDDMPGLERLVRENEPELLVVDPLVAHLPEKVNSWNDQSVRSALQPLYRLAENFGCSVLGVMHLNKAQGADPAHRVSGSVAFRATARSVLLLGRDPDNMDGESRVLVRDKCNLGPPVPALRYEIKQILIPASDDEPEVETARLEFVEECDISAGDVLAGAVDTEEKDARSDAEEFLLAELADGPQPQKQIQAAGEQQGLTIKQLRRAFKKLKGHSKRVGFGAGGVWHWSLQPIDSDELTGGQRLDVDG
jgi:hypothetical protein